MRVWLLSDGQPGHDSRSQGIVRALREVIPLDVQTIRLEMRMGLARNILRYLLNRSDRPRSLRALKVFYRVDRMPDGGCDLLVSAGGKTSFANAWMAAAIGTPNIYAGTLRRLQPNHFNVVMTLEPVPGADNNLVVPLLPTAFEMQSVAEQGEQLRQQLGDTPQRYWLMLLGGNGAGYQYRQRDWIHIAHTMNALAHRYGIRWLVATSRRTGKIGERTLKQSIDALYLARACWNQAGDLYPGEAFLGVADQVFVSEDSMTMLTEAMSAQRPVYSLCPEHALPDNRYEQALLRYVDAGRLHRFVLNELVEQPELFEDQRYEPEALPERDLGQELARRINLDRKS